MWPTPWNRGDLDRRDRTGWTYAPGTGLTSATSPTGGRFLAHSHNGSITLVVADAPTETQVMVATSATPREVRIDGRLVPQATGPLSESTVGWTTRPAPFGGILLKLHPRAGLSTVTITT